jgi:hypothetical protein
MSKQTRYLLTVDSATGAAVKLERLGEAGDLTEVPLSTLAMAPAGVLGASPAPQPLVINIYMGGPQQAAPLSISAPGFVGPGGTAATAAPGGPGQVSLFSVPEARAASSQAQGPGGPGSPTTPAQGPGAPGAAPASTQGPGGPTGGGEGGSR